ncbi:orotidine-5'-phosphate decarboxylase [Dethiosulfovibrio sp. F2B]|uniref:orotidine-5'-phosphate decarboxylase n=1 Tax=Dethiosulfovibrio faecalis TaxID=2720018 RepID=UPI001F1BD3CE|nr:orotidine-5'-phosphate decarboxylase [Dethiosulfovibrio faecalis]MCF4150359.1 orotidine-5'-phosphate decarboxylase [Dethiosulfovibrio faecalis]
MHRDDELPLIMALDLETLADARKTLNLVRGKLDYVKIGPRLFALGGVHFVKEMVDYGFKVFLDLKLHDIPNTIRLAVEAFGGIGLWSLTLHAAGGRRMLEEAVAARDRMGSSMKLFGISVLTSFNEEVWSEATPGCPMEEALRQRAWLCDDSGLDGVVCSPLDLPVIKDRVSPGLLKVVPGVRLTSLGDDQTRIATPCQAIKNGADYVVMGRPIYKADDIESAMNVIGDSIREGLKG